VCEQEESNVTSGAGSWNLFDHILWSTRPLFSLSRRSWNPPADVSETPERLYIHMDIAGVSPDGLSVTLEHGNLIIRGKRCHRSPGEEEEFHVMEIRYGCFERVFRLPVSVVEDGIRASYRDGLLDIEIPKGRGEGKVVNITVREG